MKEKLALFKYNVFYWDERQFADIEVLSRERVDADGKISLFLEMVYDYMLDYKYPLLRTVRGLDE